MTEKTYKFRGIGLTPAEKKWAGRRFKEYQKNYHIDNFSNSQLLEELVYRETIQERVKKEIKKKAEKNEKDDKLTQTKLPAAFNDNLELIIELKERLGLFEKKEEASGYTAIKNLEEKFRLHRLNNKAEYSIPCPHCGEMQHLKFRTKFYDVTKHPFFRGKFLTNDHLIKLCKQGKISKEDVSKILGVSNDYVDWIIEKYYSSKQVNSPSK